MGWSRAARAPLAQLSVHCFVRQLISPCRADKVRRNPLNGRVSIEDPHHQPDVGGSKAAVPVAADGAVGAGLSVPRRLRGPRPVGCGVPEGRGWLAESDACARTSPASPRISMAWQSRCRTPRKNADPRGRRRPIRETSPTPLRIIAARNDDWNCAYDLEFVPLPHILGNVAALGSDRRQPASGQRRVFQNRLGLAGYILGPQAAARMLEDTMATTRWSTPTSGTAPG
jgi:hypothetical protein